MRLAGVVSLFGLFVSETTDQLCWFESDYINILHNVITNRWSLNI